MKEKFRTGIFIFLFCTAVGLMIPATAFAASYQMVNTSQYSAPESRTVAGYTFLTTENGTLLISKDGSQWEVRSKSGKVGWEIITDGKAIYYYTRTSGYPCISTFYRANIDGSGIKKLFRHKTDTVFFVNIYKNRLYYITDLDPGTFRSYNLKTKKKVKIAKNVTTATQHKQFFYLFPYEGTIFDNCPFRVYDSKKGTVRQISSRKAGCHITKNKVYYFEFIKFDYTFQKTVVRLKCCNLNGTGKRVLIKKLRTKNIPTFKNRYIIYQNHNGKTRKIKYR